MARRRIPNPQPEWVDRNSAKTSRGTGPDERSARAADFDRGAANARLVDPENPDLDDFETGYDGPSKSQRKRDMTALQKLGEQLIALPTPVLRGLELPERLVDAILEMNNTRTHEGRRRQMQFIGRLMRDVDPEPIQRLLDHRERPHRDEVAAMHEAERWRERLIEDDRLVVDFVERYAVEDLQQLRSNIRAARLEHASQRHGRQYRLLYKRLRAAMAGPTESALADSTDDFDTEDDNAFLDVGTHRDT
jgi:ribosome-associated protein